MFLVKCLILPWFLERRRIDRIYSLASKLHRATFQSAFRLLGCPTNLADTFDVPVVQPLLHNHWYMSNGGTYRIPPQNTNTIAAKAPERLPIVTINELLEKAKYWIDDLDLEYRISSTTSQLELTRTLEQTELDKLRTAAGGSHSSRHTSGANVQDSNKTRASKLKSPLARVPRTIVCHDYRGGYCASERYLQGSDEQVTYNIYHWQYIDTYIYFSHHLVTIPPPSLIAQCHRNGVQCLGTFITEWEKGWEICASIMCTREGTRHLAVALATACVKYGFDGWLINIENPLDEEFIDNLVYFVKVLTQVTHALVDGGQVIWYDSVTIFGRLKWQNELNLLNDIFMRESDGIFLNYAWTDERLFASRSIAEVYAPVARGKHTIAHNGRTSDVYAGIDVYGRGCFGGGGFNSNLALEKIAAHGLSTAIFAPGWVHENLPTEEYDSNQSRFWTDLLPYLKFRPLTDSQLPFRTNYNIGVGQGYWLSGKDARNINDNINMCMCSKSNIAMYGRDDGSTTSTDRDSCRIHIENRCMCHKSGMNPHAWSDIAQQDQCVGVRGGWEAVSSRSGLRVRVAQCNPSADVTPAGMERSLKMNRSDAHNCSAYPACACGSKAIQPDSNYIHNLGGAYEGPCVLEICPTEGIAAKRDDVGLDIDMNAVSSHFPGASDHSGDQHDEHDRLLGEEVSATGIWPATPRNLPDGSARLTRYGSTTNPYSVRVLDCELDRRHRYVVSIVYAVRSASSAAHTGDGSSVVPYIEVSAGWDEGCVVDRECTTEALQPSASRSTSECANNSSQSGTDMNVAKAQKELIEKASLSVGDWQLITMKWPSNLNAHRLQGDVSEAVSVGIDLSIAIADGVAHDDWCVVVGEVSVRRESDERVQNTAQLSENRVLKCTHSSNSTSSPIRVHDVVCEQVIYQGCSTSNCTKGKASFSQARECTSRAYTTGSESHLNDGDRMTQLTCTLRWDKDEMFTCGKTCTCVTANPVRYRIWASASQVCTPTPPYQLYLGETSDCSYTILGLCIQPLKASGDLPDDRTVANATQRYTCESVRQSTHNHSQTENIMEQRRCSVGDCSSSNLAPEAGIWLGVYPICALGHCLGGGWVHV